MIEQDTEWPFGPLVTEAAPEVATHTPPLRWADVPANRRVIPMSVRHDGHFVASEPQGYTPPFWVGMDGMTLTSETGVYPGCPPMQAGQKALMLDDWSAPKVITVTEMRESQVVGMLGDLPVMSRAWVALEDEATLSAGPLAQAPGSLTDEEADALDKEFEAWARYLGVRAEKYGWCGTFENILGEVGIKPWRPGFKTVTLRVTSQVDPTEELSKAFTESIGGEAKAVTTRMNLLITLKDVTRDQYNAGTWTALLNAAGYRNFSDIYIHSKEVEEA